MGGAGAVFGAFAAAAAADGAAGGLIAVLLITGGVLGFAAVSIFVGVAIYQLIAAGSDPATPAQATATANPNTGAQTVTITSGTISTPDNLSQASVEQLLDFFNANGTFPDFTGQLPDPGQLLGGTDGDGGGDVP